MTANAAMAARALNVFMKAQAPPFAAAGRERDGRAAKEKSQMDRHKNSQTPAQFCRESVASNPLWYCALSW